MKKIHREYVIIAVFWILIGTAYYWWGIFGAAIEQANNEKRDLAAWPAFSLESIGKFPKAVEDYIDDHLPFRNQLIALNSAIDYYLFHSSSSDRVVVGKDGWLFYVDEEDGDPIEDYKGHDLLSQEELEQIGYNMVITRDRLAEQGIQFVIFIAPNKERVYSGQLPYGYGSPATEYRTQQIVNFLRDNTDIPVVYPVNEIIGAANMLGPETPLYYLTDTHWNELGAYVGTRELLSVLGVDLPAYNSSEITLTHVLDEPGDLAEMLDLTDIMDVGETVAVSGYDMHGYETLEDDFYTNFRYKAENADPRKIVVRRDSFGTNMAPIIGSQFSESVLVHKNGFENSMIVEERPDIFVLGTVERYAPTQLSRFIYE